MSGKYALIIGNFEYTDPGLAQLTAPGKDAQAFAQVLADANLCAFDDVKVLLNEPHYAILEAIDGFFYEKKPDDLLILYFSGHGIRDELGSLYLAVKNTNRYRLRSTAIKSDSLRELMDQSRSKRQILILDCCNSGAFSKGQKAATAMSLGTASAFEVGYGRIVLTASDSTQFAWEGDQVIGETENSLFTYFLMKGLEGEADLDCDGRITVDELYDYTYEQVKLATPKQTPSKFSDKQQGEIVLRQITRLEDIKPASLPEQLASEIKNLYPEVRLRAVEQLAQLLSGKNLGLARSARAALEALEAEDDSRRVSQAASRALELLRQAELLAMQKAEEERIEREKAEAQRKAEEERLAREKAEAERKAEEERLAAEKAKAEEVTRTEQLRREQVLLEARYKAEQERLLKEKAELEARLEQEQKALEQAERKAKQESVQEEALGPSSRPKREWSWKALPRWLVWVGIGIGIAVVIGFVVLLSVNRMRNNLALNKPVITSQEYPKNPGRLAVNGNPDDWWSAGNFAPQWIEIDLGASYTIYEFVLLPSQSPDGDTVHLLYVRSPEIPGQNTLVFTFRGFTSDNSPLHFKPPEPLHGIRYVRVVTLTDPSWVGWREIQVIGGK